MENKKKGLNDFYLLWGTQSLSQLGSSITAFSLTLWLYEKTGSALSTASLTICSYFPYVIMSIFAGAISDRFNKKKTMLICDAFAALMTVLVFVLYKADLLLRWHLYAINALLGLMNTIQQPASEVTYSLIIPKEEYQRTGGLQYLSRSLVSIGSPLIASMLYGFAGLDGAILTDLLTFTVAFLSLIFFIRIPEIASENQKEERMLELAKEGIGFLKNNPLVLNVILFMSGVNLIASAFDAVLPALVIPSVRGGNAVLGVVTSCSGVAMVIGSVLATIMPKPKDRVRMIYLTMLFSLGTENFLLALSRNPIVWCAGQILGWIFVPVMSANLNVIMRNSIPIELQGRVYACRNTLQFFTIPIGLLLGGYMVDEICEPFMAAQSADGLMRILFGTGKGSGAALMMFILGVAGILVCLLFRNRLKQYHYTDTEEK